MEYVEGDGAVLLVVGAHEYSVQAAPGLQVSEDAAVGDLLRGKQDVHQQPVTAQLNLDGLGVVPGKMIIYKAQRTTQKIVVPAVGK